MARLIRTEKEVEGRYTEQWVVVEEDPLAPLACRAARGRRAAGGAGRRPAARPR